MNKTVEELARQLAECKKELELIVNDNNLSATARTRKIDTLSMKIAKFEDKIEKHKNSSGGGESESEYKDAATEWLSKNNIFHVQKQDAYIEKLEDNTYEIFPKASMKDHYYEWTDERFRLAVSLVMEEQKRKFKLITYSFRKTPEWTLNLMDKSGWLQPQDGKHHWAFDCLMTALGGGKAENIRHLEHVLTYKYLHPESFKLPALVIFGEGSVGKNLLVDMVLQVVFGRAQSVSLKTGDVLGPFNSRVKGKTVVLINEAVSEKTDMEGLKDLLHKQEITVNEKFVAQYSTDNTPLYILGGNSMDSAVRLGGDHSDRRFSIMKVPADKTLISWIADKNDWAEEIAKKWLDENDAAVFGNPVEVAKWLNNLIATYWELPFPHALHGDDYKELLRQQASMDQRIIEAVFTDPSFSAIERMVLYEGYKVLLNEYGNARYKLSDAKLYARVEEWLAKNAPHIKYGETRWNGRTGKKSYVWWNTNRPMPTVDTRDKYFLPNNPWHWNGPDISGCGKSIPVVACGPDGDMVEESPPSSDDAIIPFPKDAQKSSNQEKFDRMLSKIRRVNSE